MQDYFSRLLPLLSERAKHAAISRLGFANDPLRQYLNELFSSPYGETGSFLADPTFEATFGWKTGNKKLCDLDGSLLAHETVAALSSDANGSDYCFALDRKPYLHQLSSWRILADPKPQSLVVASGTGSGKTECFMVPILDRLVRCHLKKGGKLIGVRAMFLYPLNALINSQRERLRAWTQHFGDNIRFCLYNGNTPEKMPAHERSQYPNEAIDREQLRTLPPPILVTNATMLEYMLVRNIDAPILERSQGKLEWFVLDEAHTYIGSQAAEIALLIRRVLHAFGVSPEQVRFVATSATIGDPNGEAGKRLKEFLADVAGVSPDRVHLIAGERFVPSLPEPSSIGIGDLYGIEDIARIDPHSEISNKRYNTLASHPVSRKLREMFIGDTGKPPIAKLSDVCKTLHLSAEEALRWLDLCSGTKNSEKIPFLPLRAHLFHQTLTGLWACADYNCRERSGTCLDNENWRFGKLYLEPRKHCDCGAPVYEVVSCDDCGSVYLLAGEAGGQLHHWQPGDVDEFALDAEEIELSEDDELLVVSEKEIDKGARQNRVLIVNQHVFGKTGTIHLDRRSRSITEPGNETLLIEAQEDAGEGLRCPTCEAKELSGRRRALFQSSRLGAPFMLGQILPTLLEFAPDGDDPALHPYRGRRVLTFNDSRQGTARIAAKLQQDSERHRVRGLVYHLTLQHGRLQAGAEAEELRVQIAEYERQLAHVAPEGRAFFEQQLEEKRKRLRELERPVPMMFEQLAERLADQEQDIARMMCNYRKWAPGLFGGGEGSLTLARMFLVREFARRPKRANNLESMGMVAVRYPALERARVPQAIQDIWRRAGLGLNDWRDFLKICLDFFVRSGGSLAFPKDWLNWLGMPFRQTWVIDPSATEINKRQRRWPSARSGLQSTLVRILCKVLDTDISTPDGEDRVDTILRAAWSELKRLQLLRQDANGWRLPLSKMAFSPMEKAFICPITRRFLDTTFRSTTPYLPRKATSVNVICEQVDLPLYDLPFGGETDEHIRIIRARDWVAKQGVIAQLRRDGYWIELNNRVIELAPYFTAAEHSAGQDSETLRRYEQSFKAGDLNILSCSTTMEMGIDIGGIGVVAMNNVPPHPANYLQRAGRAGRRGETRSIVMTLCKSNPHDQNVFADSSWAFETPLPAPRVSLESQVIIERHINALVLRDFLAEMERRTSLTCGWFFLANDNNQSFAEQFIARCKAFREVKNDHLIVGLRQLLQRTLLQDYRIEACVHDVGARMEDITKEWLAEWNGLEEQLQAIVREAGVNDIAYKAILHQQKRLRDEYLLRELATRGFLPGYGFPTNIVSFDNMTIADLSRRNNMEQKGREENRYQRRDLPSRDRALALREYAPGGEVVKDGLVYRSKGITLNWHIPADQAEANETQAIRYAWRCRKCGASGSAASLEQCQNCLSCHEPLSDRPQAFIIPAGFSVDFYDTPTNDITHQNFVPVEPPWISVNAEWTSLPNPRLGRFRTTTNGHVYIESRGVNRLGYAICLACGRAEPMQQGVSGNSEMPTLFQSGKTHYRLRGPRRGQQDACPGSINTWQIKRDLALGHEFHTDVLEIQLCGSNGRWLTDNVIARTFAVALRDELSARLGIQPSELGCTSKDARAPDGSVTQSILIYDRFAAGYASSFNGKSLEKLLLGAKGRLECPKGCDSACPHCLLDFDQRFAAETIDRIAANQWFSRQWQGSLVQGLDS